MVQIFITTGAEGNCGKNIGFIGGTIDNQEFIVYAWQDVLRLMKKLTDWINYLKINKLTTKNSQGGKLNSPTKTMKNNHATINGLIVKQAEKLFQPTIKILYLKLQRINFFKKTIIYDK